MRRLAALTILVFVFVNGIHAGDGKNIEAKIESLLAKMTLEEKVGQLQQYTIGEPDSFRQMTVAGEVGSFLNVRNIGTANLLQKWRWRSPVWGSR